MLGVRGASLLLPPLLPQSSGGRAVGAPLSTVARAPDSIREGCVFHPGQWLSALAAHQNPGGKLKNGDQRLDPAPWTLIDGNTDRAPR